MNNPKNEVLSTDIAYEHVWVEGEWLNVHGGKWIRKKAWRNDHCAICQCIRTLFLATPTGEAELLGYKRNDIEFGKEPTCWGGTEPT